MTIIKKQNRCFVCENLIDWEGQYEPEKGGRRIQPEWAPCYSANLIFTDFGKAEAVLCCEKCGSLSKFVVDL